MLIIQTLKSIAMKPSQPIAILALLAIMLQSCASNYGFINPKIVSYGSKNTSNEIALEYQYDLLQKKYRKKERKNDVRLVAIKITNLSDRDLVVGQDLKLVYENGTPLRTLETKAFYNETKQMAGMYLLYMLLTPVKLNLSTTNGNGSNVESIPIGYGLGPGLALGNLFVASSANGRYRKDLKTHQLMGRTIKKGTTEYGLVGIRSSNYDAIKFKIE